VDLSVVERRYCAALALERGEPKMVVAVQFGFLRQMLYLYTWLTQCARDGLAGLMVRVASSPSRREPVRWSLNRVRLA